MLTLSIFQPLHVSQSQVYCNETPSASSWTNNYIVALTNVNPYLPEMIESFGVPQDDVARWAGFTSAAFSVAQCFTAMFWVRASERFGRKPVIMISLACTMSTTLLLGFSQNLAWAVIARALGGAANGNVGIIRTTGLRRATLRIKANKADMCSCRIGTTKSTAT